jgi:hypothetical protein
MWLWNGVVISYTSTGKKTSCLKGKGKKMRETEKEMTD